MSIIHILLLLLLIDTIHTYIYEYIYTEEILEIVLKKCFRSNCTNDKDINPLNTCS